MHMPSSVRPQCFTINTDRSSYRKHHPLDRDGDPFRFWIKHGCGFITPQKDSTEAVRRNLDCIRTGDFLFAYESSFRDTKRGFIAVGVAGEVWDRKDYRGRDWPELFNDPNELVYRITVHWSSDFSFSLAEMQAIGFPHPQGTIVRRTEQYAQPLWDRLDLLQNRWEHGHQVAEVAEPVWLRPDPQRDARAWMEAAMGSAAVEDGDLRDNPLQVVWNGKALATDAVFGQSPGDMPRDNDVRTALLAGATFRSSPDRDDEVLGSLLLRDDLSTEVKREIKARIGQGRFRAALLQFHGGCVVTEVTTPSVLRAAHIHRWADCVDDTRARTDLENGLLLTANLDALFESGLVTFDDDGIIVISPRLDSTMRHKLAIHPDMRLRRPPSTRQRVYLQKHRARTAAVREGGRM